MKQMKARRYRHEYKYRIDERQKVLLRFKAESLLMPDPHVNSDGFYTIRSAYFDDDKDSCLLENQNGTDPRSKFRLRYYNKDTSRITLEKKSKVKGMCLKEAGQVSYEECELLLSGAYPEITDRMDPLKQKLFSELVKRNLHPRVIVSYDRIPFIYPAGNVRITFDQNISSSSELSSFLSGSYHERPILPLGESILEVKWDELLPRHIKEMMKLDSLTWQAFSKYYMCRLYHL